MGPYLGQAFWIIFSIITITLGQASDWENWPPTSSLDVDTVTQPSPQTDATCTTVLESLTSNTAEASAATVPQTSYGVPASVATASETPAATSQTACAEGETSTVTLTAVRANTTTIVSPGTTSSPEPIADTSVLEISTTLAASVYGNSVLSNSTPTQVAPISQSTTVQPAIYTGAANPSWPGLCWPLTIVTLFLLHGYQGVGQMG